MMTSRCKSCNAEIVWVTTPSGKTMPLNAMTKTLWAIEPDGAQCGSPRAKPVQVRESHFATCKDADAWRKPKEQG
jgi:hypothetical protein